MSQEPHNNLLLYAKSIPRTMPMLPKDPRDARIELIVTYHGHKQSRGLEIRMAPEDVLPLLHRMEQFLVAEGNYFMNKVAIDRQQADI